MDRLRRNARAMIRRRGPYEVFALILTLGLFAMGEPAAAALVALVLVVARHRVIRDGP